MKFVISREFLIPILGSLHLDEEISEPVKKINEVKKSVPYEQDTAWEPGQEDEAEVGSCY